MKALAAVAALAMLCACGDSSGSNDGGNNNTGGNGDSGTGNDAGTNDAGTGGGFLIGGRILTAGASLLVLQTPGEPNLTIPASYQPGFAFANRVPTGTHYNVTVASQPPSTACNNAICTCTILDGGVGVVGTTDVADVLVACAIMLP